MTYQPQQPPVVAGYATQPSQGDWKPPKAKSRAVPILAGLVAVLALAVAGLTLALLRANDSSKPADSTAGPGAAFAKAKEECGVVAGYLVEDAGKTLVLTVGGAFVSTSAAACVFDKLGVPDAVRQHVSTTRALDGQQTDSWTGYSARWTYHPDDGLQMTIRAA